MDKGTWSDPTELLIRSRIKYIRGTMGTKQIDAVWRTRDMRIKKGSYLTFHKPLG